MSEQSTSRAHRGALAVQDLVVVGYMVLLATLLWARSPPPGPGPVLRTVLAWMVVVPLTAFVARAVPEIPFFLRVNAYRVVIVAVLPSSYLLLRDVLPIVRPDALDAMLVRWDVAVFGVQPVLWMERFNHRPIVEWLSFFYFNYYTLIFVNTIAVVWFLRDKRVTAELGVGMTLLYCLGQVGYMIVPALGPLDFCAHDFQGPIDGGAMYKLMSSTVFAGGAMKDEFPSMHTGGSTFVFFFAVYQATRDKRWRLPALLNGFIAANIVVSTLILRWHYAVDLLAGATLSATVAFLAVPRIARWETARRARLGQAPVFPEA
jgi:membrane-associated phospholipid phosphatase